MKQEANGHLLKPLFPEINSTLVQPISTAYPLFLGTPNTARSMQVWPILVLMLCHPNKLRIQMVSQSHKYASMCAHVHVHTCTHTHTHKHTCQHFLSPLTPLTAPHLDGVLQERPEHSVPHNLHDIEVTRQHFIDVVGRQLCPLQNCPQAPANK